jgi:glycosyltransferase involved in cell wall biosynthesis
VPPRNAIALAEAIISGLEALCEENWQLRCRSARQRIEDNFSIQRMVERYEQVWSEAVSN